jgi:hypothetical protein
MDVEQCRCLTDMKAREKYEKYMRINRETLGNSSKRIILILQIQIQIERPNKSPRKITYFFVNLIIYDFIK